MKTLDFFFHPVLFLALMSLAATAATGCGNSKFQSGSSRKVSTGDQETAAPAATQSPQPSNPSGQKQQGDAGGQKLGTGTKGGSENTNQDPVDENANNQGPATPVNVAGGSSSDPKANGGTQVSNPMPSSMPGTQSSTNPGTQSSTNPGTGQSGSGQVNNPMSTTQPSQPPVVTMPKPAEFTSDNGDGLSSDDKDSIAKCLAQWPNHPFVAGNTYSVRKISLAFSVGGITLGGDDTATPNPKLVLITQSINLGIFDGGAVYNFMNPNGYYCMKNQFNLLASVEINLHCKARLASSSKQFNVLSATNGAPSQNQINLLSNVVVRRVCN